MEVDFVVPGFDQTVGLSRYADSLLPELRKHCEVTVRRPKMPSVARKVLSPLGDAEKFFSTFPLAYEEPTGDVLHLSTQTLGIPLLYNYDMPTVATVHDIFPYMLPKIGFEEPGPWYERGMYRLAMRGLQKVDHIIADSEATKRSLIEWLDIPEERISVVYLGVDRETFKPMDVPDEVYERYGLNPANRHVLYVGSEHKRKAVPELVEAFSEVAADIEDVVLVKAGGPQDPAGRERTLAAVRECGVEDRVVFTGYVPEEDLPCLYNLADVFASASYYEGFGFPFVEAMACGTPAVGRDQSAMKEVVLEDALLYDATSDLVALLRAAIFRGSSQSIDLDTLFVWRDTARETFELLNALA